MRLGEWGLVDDVPCGEEPGGEEGSTTSGSAPDGPGAGLRPSRMAFAISAAFHFAYRIFSSFWPKLAAIANQKIINPQIPECLLLGRSSVLRGNLPQPETFSQ
jgi:hypothetical protein